MPIELDLKMCQMMIDIHLDLMYKYQKMGDFEPAHQAALWHEAKVAYWQFKYQSIQKNSKDK